MYIPQHRHLSIIVVYKSNNLQVHNSYGTGGYVRQIRRDEMTTLKNLGHEDRANMPKPLSATKHMATEDEYKKDSSIGAQKKSLSDLLWPAAPPKAHIIPKKYTDTKDLLDQVFGSLPVSSFDDLKLRTKEEVRGKLKKVFEELPTDGFVPGFKNPCWHRINHDGDKSQQNLECLPFIYLLGQPKCGTSDIFERITKHQHVVPPRRKEVRWFTRGEFSYEKLPEHQRLGEATSIYSFTESFKEKAVHAIVENPEKVITIDGGPHTLWWPTQDPDGSLSPQDIPAPQIIREMQPNAKFIITLCDPVKRMYSDYNFLGDDLKPVKSPKGRSRGSESGPKKSPEEFAARALTEVSSIKACIESLAGENGWFRASQICAHDRHKFAVGGHGRIAISLYILFIEKWLEHFNRDQFLILRLEDYHDDPANYMKRVFRFLELDEPENWSDILSTKIANKNIARHADMLPETELILRQFFQV